MLGHGQLAALSRLAFSAQQPGAASTRPTVQRVVDIRLHRCAVEPPTLALAQRAHMLGALQQLICERHLDEGVLRAFVLLHDAHTPEARVLRAAALHEYAVSMLPADAHGDHENIAVRAPLPLSAASHPERPALLEAFSCAATCARPRPHVPAYPCSNVGCPGLRRALHLCRVAEPGHAAISCTCSLAYSCGSFAETQLAGTRY